MVIKVYMVLQRINLPKKGEPNVKILAAKLTREAAQEIVNAMPGTYIKKMYADK